MTSVLPLGTFRLQTGDLIRRVTKERCVQYPYLTEEKDGDDYYYSKILLHYPWRDEAHLLGDYSTAAQMFAAVYTQFQLPTVSAGVNKDAVMHYAGLGDEVRHALTVQRELNDANPDDAGQDGLWQGEKHESMTWDADGASFEGFAPPQAQNEGAGWSAMTAPHGTDTALFMAESSLPDAEWKFRLQRLTPSQRRVYELITQHHKAVRTATQLGTVVPEPLRLFITGGAGVGKSHMIDTIREYLRRSHALNSHPCMLMAPTGVAAFNIGGLTIHRALGIRVEKSDGDALAPSVNLEDEELQQKRAAFKDVRYIIIDEISMVSYQMLLKIDCRLRQIAGGARQSQPFGGFNIIAVGDLYQLQPVRGLWIFLSKTSTSAVQHLWTDLFQCEELTENVRQNQARRQGAATEATEDTHWSQLLNRLRVGQQTTKDKQFIATRLPKERGGGCASYTASRAVS